jgi:hypothetical protein
MWKEAVVANLRHNPRVSSLYRLRYRVSELGLSYAEGIHIRRGPCPHSMARPRVADGGMASSYGG